MTPERVPPPPRNGLAQAAGEAATTLAQGLKTQPLIIGLLLVNLGFMGVVFVSVREARLQDHHEMRLLLERCVPQK